MTEYLFHSLRFLALLASAASPTVFITPILRGLDKKTLCEKKLS